jgi:hypothetical protein
MNKLLAVMIYALCSICFDESNFLKSQSLFPFKENNFWGYKDNTGSVRVVPKYDTGCAGVSNLYLVKNGTSFGVLGRQGQELLPPVFEQVWFGEALRWGGAIVGLKNRRYTILDDKGTFLLQADHLEATGRGSKYMLVKDGERWAIVSGKGEWLARLKSRPVHLYDGGSYCVIDTRHAKYYSAQGKFRFKTKTGKRYSTSALEFRNGYAPILIEKREWKRSWSALVHKHYSIPSEPRHDRRRMTFMEIITRSYRNAIDTNGRYFLPCGYSLADGPYNGYAIAYSPNGKSGYGIVGPDRSFVVPPIYDNIERQDNGVYRLRKKDEVKHISISELTQ